MSDETQDVQEVEATPIDPPVQRTAIDDLVAQAEALEARLGTDWQATEIADYDGYRQASRERTALNKEIRRVESERVRLFERIDAQKARIGDALRPAKQASKAYKERIDEYKGGVVQARLNELEEAYHDLAPECPVAFSLIDAKWGEADGWHRFSANQVEMERQLEAHVTEIAHNEQVIRNGNEPDEDKERWRSEYFRTLDFVGAARIAQEAREARERTRRLDEEREAREAWQREQRAQAEPYVPEGSPVPAEAEPEHDVPQGPQAAPMARPAQTPTRATNGAPAQATASTGASGELYEEYVVCWPKARHAVAMAALKAIPGSHGRRTREYVRGSDE